MGGCSMGSLSQKFVNIVCFCLLASPVFAQEASTDTLPEVEEIIVTGEIQQGALKSLEVKRDNTVISDALFGADLGELPDLSIAESLERMPGVTSDRFKGGASEMSVRGLGAFLSYSTFNGREITSGSDGRQVNFGQFPSELVSGTIAYKSQQASMVEGGVSGTIELLGLKPIDYGKRRVQIQGLFGYNDYEARVDGGEGLSQRYTASFVDSWDTDNGKWGIAVGGQLRDDTAPEDFFTTSSSYRPCITQHAGGSSVRNYASSNCSANDDDNVTSAAVSTELGVPFYLVSNQYIWRAMKTDADKDSFFATVQWQPNDELDLTLDYQFSDRFDSEERANLVLADGRRRITPIEIADNGALMAWTGNTRIENQTVYRVREETFESIGLNGSWSRDRLKISGDVSFNKSERNQDELDMRIRRNSRIDYTADRRGTNVMNFVIEPSQAFDLMDHSVYDNGTRARRRLEDNTDEIFAIKIDLDYELDDDFMTRFKTGIRSSSRQRVNDDGIDRTASSSCDSSSFCIQEGGYLSEGAIAARRDTFLVEDFFEGADTDFALTQWATWDAVPLYNALTGGGSAGLFDPGQSTMSTHDTDVTEDITAVYGQIDFATEMFGLPASGNLGVRIVNTKIESVGISSDISTALTAPDNLAITMSGGTLAGTETNSFTNVLPSANVSLELREDMLLRFAAYQAIARPDARLMSAALDLDDIDVDPTQDGFSQRQTIAAMIQPQGNPQLEVLEATNFDVSWEWYISDDSAVSVAAYHKDIKAGLNAIVTEQLTLMVDGAPSTFEVSRFGNSDDSSTLTGIEIAGQHQFSTLPPPFNGLRIQGNINIADSDYETPDPTTVGGSAYPMRNFVDPANIIGFSDHSLNGEISWENKDVSLRLAYKERTDYFKDYRQGALRYVSDQGFLDFQATYKIDKTWQLRFQALNLMDEPNIMNRPLKNQVAEANYSGTRLFFGVKGRF
jgi:iron complex outermembrane receptor protein